MDKRRVIYYRNEPDEELSLARITPRRIDGSYRYLRDRPLEAGATFMLRPLALFSAYLYPRVVFWHRVEGRERLAPYVGSGYFLYGNHTQDIADALIPSTLAPKKKTYVIVHPSNVSMPLLGRITPYLGALPLPDDKAARENFKRAIDRIISDGGTIAIYPEAHIWPYYTEIRPFSDDSFYYPVRYGVPSFCFTNTYQRGRSSRAPRIVTYIDGPFFADRTLPYRMQRAELRDRIYAVMCRRARLSTEERIKYVRIVDTDD